MVTQMACLWAIEQRRVVTRLFAETSFRRDVSRHVSTQGVFAISVRLLFALLAAEERGEPEDDDGADDGCADLTD